MFPGGSLASRLLIGLLAVTSLGLIVSGVVSFVTLRTFITEQIDQEVESAAERGMDRLERDPPPMSIEAPSPSPYFVVLVDPDSGDAFYYSGDTPREDVVIDRIDLLPVEQLRTYGITGEIFDLEGVTDSVHPHRATVRLSPDWIMISGVPADEREMLPLQLVSTQLITAGVLIFVLVLAGRWLMVRGLAPLDRMATKANEISTGSDLGARMPEAHSKSEVGRLSLAINTMLARIEEAFQRQQESEERVRAFAADASHELRTPLTTIRGYTELYRQGAIPEQELPGAMRRVEDEAERMSQLVAQLLELARLDRGNELHLAPSDLAAIARDMAADAEAVEPGRPISVATPDQLVWRVDEARFRQVLSNLLANVREHTAKDAALTIRLSAEDGDVARLDVSDSGAGMAVEDLNRAFDRFYRGHRAPGGGSGLGLAIVRAIATAHGGDVRIDSAPGEGTTVTVLFPDTQDPSEPPLH